MSLLVVLIGAYVVCLANNLGSAYVDETEWINYKLQYGKVYDSKSGVDTFRRSIYEQNRQLVDKFNKKRPEAKLFQLKLNHLADWTESEMSRLNGLRPELGSLKGRESSNSPEEQAFLDEILNDRSIPVPDALDWRQTPGRVSKVKNQGNCGSCWAFAAVGALEGQENVRHPKSLEKLISGNGLNNDSAVTLLSEQNLVDCVDYGCDGGLPEDAFRYVSVHGGIEDERSYPYQENSGQCRFNQSKVAFSDAGAAMLPIGDEQALKEVVAKFGPVTVAMDASDPSFMFYGTGVYASIECKSSRSDLDHAVLVVGYGSDPNEGDYWIVKNSWGPGWGESGYFRISRNDYNMCGIATSAVIPTF